MNEKYSPATAWLICQVWAFILLLPLSADFTTAHNRYLMYWAPVHLWVFLGMMFALGTVMFGVGLVLRKVCPSAYSTIAGMTAITSLLFLAWFFWPRWSSGSFRVVYFTPISTLLAILLTVVVIQRGWTIDKIRRGMSRAAVFMAFFIPIFIFTTFSYPTYSGPAYPKLSDIPDRKTTNKPRPADNVYVFIFDEWPYRLTMKDGKPNKLCPNLQKLAENMCVFTEGHSAGCHTLISVPRFLFEREELYVLRGEKAGFWTAGGFYPSQEQTSVFTKARDRGYRTYMVGWHHNYHAMLGNQVDYLYQVCSADLVDHTPFGFAAGFSWKWARRFLGPVLGDAVYCSNHVQRNVGFYHQNEKLVEKSREVLADPRPTGQFAVMHVPIPHGPFIYERDGKLKDLSNEYPFNSVPLCQNHVVYLDRVIGEFVESLKKQGKYENSLFIVMSDHTWRFDPQVERTGKAFTHVPMMVHFPGQKKYERIDEPFSAVNLMRLVDHVHTSGKMDNLNQVIRDNGWYFAVPDEEVDMEHLTSK